MIEKACIRPKLVAESELAEVIVGQTRNVVLKYANRLGAVLFVIANNHDSLRKQE